MAVRKIALSIPEEILEQVDIIAEKLNETRSGYIAKVLAKVVNELERAKTTKRLNELFSDMSLLDEQKDLSDLFLSADGEEGQEW